MTGESLIYILFKVQSIYSTMSGIRGMELMNEVQCAYATKRITASPEEKEKASSQGQTLLQSQ